MMKNLFSLLIFVSTWSFAQPVLNSNEMAPFGSHWTMTMTQSFGVVDTNMQGANANWNFASMQPSSNFFTINIVDPSLTPHAATFPNSNYAYQEGPSLAYRYFNLSSTKMERVGSWTNTGGLRTYSDPQVEYVFPLTLGTYNHDTWHNSASTSGGIYELNCIGYGTLVLPTGTFNDVLMVRVYVEESFISFYSYFWYSSSSGIILTQYIAGDGFFIPQSLSYASSISLATDIKSNENLQSLSYTNPVTSALTIFSNSQVPDEISYKVSNSLGQEVLSGKIVSAPTIHINMEMLERGLYFVTLHEEKSGNVRILKVLRL